MALSLDFGPEPLNPAKVDPNFLKWDTAAQCVPTYLLMAYAHPAQLRCSRGADRAGEPAARGELG